MTQQLGSAMAGQVALVQLFICAHCEKPRIWPRAERMTLLTNIAAYRDNDADRAEHYDVLVCLPCSRELREAQ